MRGVLESYPIEFIDDIKICKPGATLSNTKDFREILRRCCDWADSKQTSIGLDPKLNCIHIMQAYEGQETKYHLILQD